MTFTHLLTHRVAIHHFGVTGVDRYNNDIVGELGVDTPDQPNARVDAVSADEDIRDRDQQTQRFLVFFDAGVEVTGSDELTWLDEDLRLKVDGQPLRTDDGEGAHHLELFAYVITG